MHKVEAKVHGLGWVLIGEFDNWQDAHYAGLKVEGSGAVAGWTVSPAVMDSRIIWIA